jgi:hypothetical protein
MSKEINDQNKNKHPDSTTPENHQKKRKTDLLSTIKRLPPLDFIVRGYVSGLAKRAEGELRAQRVKAAERENSPSAKSRIDEIYSDSANKVSKLEKSKVEIAGIDANLTAETEYAILDERNEVMEDVKQILIREEKALNSEYRLEASRLLRILRGSQGHVASQEVITQIKELNQKYQSTRSVVDDEKLKFNQQSKGTVEKPFKQSKPNQSAEGVIASKKVETMLSGEDEILGENIQDALKSSKQLEVNRRLKYIQDSRKQNKSKSESTTKEPKEKGNLRDKVANLLGSIRKNKDTVEEKPATPPKKKQTLTDLKAKVESKAAKARKSELTKVKRGKIKERFVREKTADIKKSFGESKEKAKESWNSFRSLPKSVSDRLEGGFNAIIDNKVTENVRQMIAKHDAKTLANADARFGKSSPMAAWLDEVPGLFLREVAYSYQNPDQKKDAQEYNRRITEALAVDNVWNAKVVDLRMQILDKEDGIKRLEMQVNSINSELLDEEDDWNSNPDQARLKVMKDQVETITQQITQEQELLTSMETNFSTELQLNVEQRDNTPHGKIEEYYRSNMEHSKTAFVQREYSLRESALLTQMDELKTQIDKAKDEPKLIKELNFMLNKVVNELSEAKKIRDEVLGKIKELDINELAGE